MIPVSERVVVVAAALLPTRVRKRYREQWLGELRDAPSLGMRPSEIAMGSLAFAASFERSMLVGGRLSSELISRRARLALAMSISAAVLAFSQTVSAPTNAQIGAEAFASAVGLAWTLLTLYAVIAPLAAIIAVLATRGTSWRVRCIVLLSAALCAVPLAHPAITNLISTSSLDRVHIALGAIALCGVAFLVLLVSTTRQRRRFDAVTSDPAAVRLRRGAIAGSIVAIAVGAAFVGASGLWASRTPLYFRGPITSSNRGEYEQWLALKATGEQLVTATLGVWLVGGLVVACAVVLSSVSHQSTLRRVVMLGIGAMSVVVLTFGLLMSFLQLMLPSIAPSFPIILATEVVQIGLVVVVLVLASRPQHEDSTTRAQDLGIDLARNR